MARAGDQGFSEDTLTTILNLIDSTPPEDFRALTIARNGKLVLDEYFNSYNRNTLHDIRSAAKSITGLLVGIALEQRLIDSLDVPLFSLFDVGAAHVTREPRKAFITLHDALTMRTGLDADADDPTTPGNEANWLDGEADWLDYLLGVPMTGTNPGERYVYNSASAFLAGAAIESRSGTSLRVYAETYLFAPLDIPEFYWSVGPGGHTAGMGNLYLTNRALTKLGQLILNDGTWKNRAVLPAGWAREITQKRVEMPNPVFDTHGYGYLWYVGRKVVGDRAVDFVYAAGNGGNMIFVVPRLNLVVAMSSSAYGTSYGSFRSHNIFAYILRAVVE